MNISLNWLSAMLGRSLDPADTAYRLTMLGAAVDAVEPLHQDLGDVIVAQVESVGKHPNADRLSLCLVNDGKNVVEVVCGAPNVTAGKKYPYAPVGSVLPGGLKLEARKIRGVSSNGMLCSAKELGLGADHSGILELNTDAAPGTPFVKAVPVADHRLVLDVTANRPDLLCHKGVARELAVLDGGMVRLVPIPGDGHAAEPARVGARGTVDGVEILIEDVDGCPRYAAAVIRGVHVGPSPEWLQAPLRSVGAGPINNVVDATNFILHELNQPLHAFDLRKLAGQKIIVRRARAGENITTLDGTARTLTTEMTAICDADRPVAVAGVMGGADSEVSPDTVDIVLECAHFNPKRIRATRTALKLSTEASYRFERGIDLQALPFALRRAVSLIVATAGGRATGATDLYPSPTQEPLIFLRPERVQHLLGTAVPRAEIERYLTSVGFTVAPREERLAVQVPGWRPDVTREVDLIEEVARLKGYGAFPVELGAFRPSTVPDDPVEDLKARLRRVFCALGLHEARSYPLGRAGDESAVALANPLSADDAYLRSDLIAGLTRAAEHNWSVRERNIRLFEVGAVFRRLGRAPGATPKDGRPDEQLHLAAVISGARVPPHWSTAGKSPDADLWDLKHLLEEAVRIGRPGSMVSPEGVGWVIRDASGETRGWARQLEADRPAWAAPLFGLEVELAGTVSLSRKEPALSA
ncbi:MAG: phenylalanine--tRNA ligase subunit beta, partial [Gemmatimonadetes bacterium]|nr:phenylalanine--tRNA ligase subunit beta [Gemmatimonadota bacterium]